MIHHSQRPTGKSHYLVEEVIPCVWAPAASQVAQWLKKKKKKLKICLSMQEMQVLSLGQEDSLEEEMATHSSILAWRIPQTEEPRRL